jgi:hypothetical protein
VARGRAAPIEELQLKLPSAPTGFLEGALDNPAMTADEMLTLLRSRWVTAELLRRVGRDRRWAQYHEIKRALVLHPRTPLVISRHLVPFLFWRDLAEVAASPRSHPVVRRQAEALLRGRVTELTVGEKTSFALRATRGVIPALLRSRETRVLRNLLSNERLTEAEAVQIAGSRAIPNEVLGLIAAHHKWGGRQAVRAALLSNPRTPVSAALGIVGRLAHRDLHRLAKDGNVPTIVRVGAQRRLQPGTAGGAAPQRRSFDGADAR